MTIDQKYRLYVQALELYLKLLDLRADYATRTPRIIRVADRAWLRFQRRHNLFLGD